jgi:hybrid cluster-associated redox disulfide protein
MKKISKDAHIEDVLTEYPGLTRVFIDFGLPCVVCGQSYWGTIADLAEKYHVNVNTLVDKLNEDLRKVKESI